MAVLLVAGGGGLVAAASLLLRPAAHAPRSLVARESPLDPARDQLHALLAAYHGAEDPCELPTPEVLATRHRIRFRRAASMSEDAVSAASPWRALGSLGVSVFFEHSSGTDRPWVALLPEYHQHEEPESFIGHLASTLAALEPIDQVQVFVESWNRTLEIPRLAGRPESYTGIEDPHIFPVSRASWDLMDLLATPSRSTGHNASRVAAKALLARRAQALLVGEHSSRREAEQALRRYAQAWNGIVATAAIPTTAMALPAAAGYYAADRWSEARISLRLAVPSRADAYGRGGHLYSLAQAVAATTSRIRTAEYAFHVLSKLPSTPASLGLVQIGANHMQPFISLLRRAGANAAILLTPASTHWLQASESWRCPLRLPGKRASTALGYFRLPGSRADRTRLRLWELIPATTD